MKWSNLICHRLPERSFFIKGHQFPVCARCTGFYISLAIVVLYDLLFPITFTFNGFIIGMILCMPFIVDGFTQYLGFRQSTNLLRLITGLLGTIGIVLAFGYIVKVLW